jgi:perosamine synthetase
MSQDDINYYEIVRERFSCLKAAGSADEMQSRRIPVKSPARHEGFLVPVCENHAQDISLIATLAEWRRRNTNWYPTQFNVTLDGTKLWLRSKVLDVPDRIMFLVTGAQDTPVGHMGFANALNPERSMKVDNVMRGVAGSGPGLMSRALRTLLEWAEREFAPRLIYLPVFGDNEHAIRFYRRLGFRDERLVPLRRHEESAQVCYRPLTAADHEVADRYHLIMTHVPTDRRNSISA